MKRFGPDDDVVEIQKAAADGDEGAWCALVERYGALVWSVARAHRLNLADAQDVYQFVWMTLTQHLGHIKQPAKLSGWLYMVARNECLRSLGRTARQIPTDQVLEPDSANEDYYADAMLLLEERNTELWRAVDELPGRCSSLLRALMSDAHDGYEEIAAQLNIPIGSVGPTRQRCLDHLRRNLALIRIKQDRDDI
jgi:RNA polymerase sigma factor (sigma-70 family)